jgi:hypothetical protein
MPFIFMKSQIVHPLMEVQQEVIGILPLKNTVNGEKENTIKAILETSQLMKMEMEQSL